MNRPVVYLDLDRTLYRTDEAARLVWEEIARHYAGIDPLREYERGGKFHSYAPNGLYYYDFAAHLNDCSLDAKQVYAAVRASSLADNRLLFRGAKKLVGWLEGHAQPALLTYGSDDYQRFKAALCPALHNLPVYTTLSSKAEWLSDKGSCWLVDDKSIGDELPDTVRFAQVSLEGRDVSQEATWPQFTSLVALQRYFEQELIGAR